MTILSISNLDKIYDTGKIALKNIDLEIEKGSFLGLLGPNGAGKSTLINIISGLVRKTSGKILINGHDLDGKTREAKSSVGIVPQELSLDPFFTIYESIENYSGFYGILPDKKRIWDLIEVLGLKDKAHNRPRSLSGGMKRRLLIAKALIHNPPLLILDEPTAGVDIELREDLWKYLKELNKSGTSIILTTHYLEEAEKLCGKIAVINHGKIIKFDEKENLLHILNTKKVTISFSSNIVSIPENLSNSADCELKNQNQLIINYNKSKIDFGEILSNLSEISSMISDIKIDEIMLQDVFKYLISNDVNE